MVNPTELHEHNIAVVPLYYSQVSNGWVPTVKEWQKGPIVQCPVALGYGIAAGELSGNIECLDYDFKHDPTNGKILEEFKEVVSNINPTLLNRLVIQSTKSDGLHLIWKCEVVESNKKLAKPEGQLQHFFETRGTGGYFVIAPTDGYTLLQGTFENIPFITIEERSLLLDCAASFGAPTEHHEPVGRAASVREYGVSPLDDYDERSDFVAFMEKYGWKIAYRRGEAYYLTRPNKPAGVSATFNYIPRRLYVFSSSTELEPHRAFRPSSVRGRLEFKGDYRACAKACAEEGYGTKKVVALEAKGLGPEDIAKFAWEGQYGDAKLFSELIGDKVCYDSVQCAWCIFDTPKRKGHWSLDTAGYTMALLTTTLIDAYDISISHYQSKQEELKKLFGEGTTPTKSSVNAVADVEKIDNLLKQIRGVVKKLGTSSYVEGVLRFCRSLLAINGTEWDSDKMVLGVKNGVVDLKTGRLRNATPSDYIRRVAPTEYDPNAKAARFEKFLSEILNDNDELVNYLHKLLGYAITGLDTEHVFPMLWGKGGRNGKDTLVKMLESVLGNELSKPVHKDVVITSGHRTTGAPSPELYDLWGARLAWIDETNEHDSINAGQLKALSGGSIISCRPLHGAQTSFSPTHTIFLLTNFKPNAPSEDEALWARIVLIPFVMRYVENPQAENERLIDKTLLRKLESEKAGVLTWLVKGCLEYQQRGLVAPNIVKGATQNYRYQQDAIELWMESMCETGDYKISAGTAYASYVNWCKLSGHEHATQVRFGQRVFNMGFQRARGAGGIMYKGFGLAESVSVSA